MNLGRSVVAILSFLLGIFPVYAATVNSVEFLNGAASSEILLRSDSPLEFEVQKNSEDRQVTLLLKGSSFAKKAMRRMDTSSFDSPVSLLSPFNESADDQPAKLVVQLRNSVEPEIKSEGNVVRLILAKGSSQVQTSVNEDKPLADSAGSTELDSTELPGDKNLDQFIQSQSTKRFAGRPITLQLRDTPIADVLTMIGEASGFNIILGDGVDGKITLSLIDVPWDQALDVVLSSKRLGAERKNNVLRVTTLANLTTEKEEQVRAKLAMERAAVRLTRVFPINFAKLQDLQKVLSNFIMSSMDPLRTAGAAGAGGAAPGFSSSSVQIDDRTNSLIVQDTYENLEKMRKLIEILDVQTPQVLIEAKIVEASENFGKGLSGSLGFSRINGQGRGVGGSFSGGSSTDGLTGAALGGNSIGGTVGYSPTIAFLPPVIDRLNLLLSMEETEEKIKVISSPKMVVLNKKEATILKSTPTTINQTVVSPGGPPIVTQTIVQANLSLKVTPTVTNAASILLQMDLSRDAVVNNIAAPRNLKTEVIVDSGSTLVIGGIYSSDETDRKNGFPFLKDLPFVGWLFGASSYRRDRSELLIFITPRVLNEQESGLISQPQEGGQTVPNQG